MTMITDKHEQAHKSILDKDRHARLLANLEGVAEQAHISINLLHAPLAAWCEEPVVSWVQHWQERMEEGSGGLCLYGKVPDHLEKKMMAIAAAFVRNYINAQVVSVRRLLELAEDGDEEAHTVLVVPNFYVKGGPGARSFTNYQMQMAQDVLLNRLTARKPTILFVQDFTSLRDEYGDAIGKFVTSNWDLIEAI